MELASRPASIQNGLLQVSRDQASRVKPDFLYGKDYVLVPPRVWKAFANWYGRSQEFQRKVIIYPIEELSLRTAS